MTALIPIARDVSLKRRLADTRRLLSRQGGVIYEAADARVLRKLEAALLDDDSVWTHLHVRDGRYRLLVGRSGRGVSFWGD